MLDKVIDVLLVEDNPDDALIIQEMLSETILTGCRVHCVEQLADGQQWLEGHDTDVILLDLILPDSRGINTLLEMKKHSPRVPIVVMTSLGHEEMGCRAIQEGAQDFIYKNDINPGILENSLRFAIERHQLSAQLENKKNKLAETERRLRHIIEKNADGIAIVDREGSLKYINPAVKELIRKYKLPADYTRQLAGRLARHIRQHQSEDAFRQPFELNLAPGKLESAVVEIRTVTVDWQGEPAFLASLRDIAERKQLEKSLLIEKERLDITLRSIADGVITTDKHGAILSCNPVVRELTGWNPDRLTGRSIIPLLGIDRLPDTRDRDDLSYGTLVLTADSSEVILEYSCAPILDRENLITGYVFIIRDITLRKKTAEEIIKVQKLESLGTVAGRLAHEYDSVLAVIQKDISAAKQYLDPDQKAYKNLEKADSSCLRARELTNQLHTFSRSRKASRQDGSILDLLHEICEELLDASPHLYPCQWAISDDLPAVEFDRDQMHNALWHIIKNAIEAMPDGGKLKIALESETIPEKAYLPLESGRYMKISITDHGTGMEREILSKIFDPFFTTRDNSTGTGLTTAFSIIRKHRGTIDVSSQKGRGSTFSLFLPEIPPDAAKRRR
jgi:PAS domain S-box-containing protein